MLLCPYDDEMDGSELRLTQLFRGENEMLSKVLGSDDEMVYDGGFPETDIDPVRAHIGDDSGDNDDDCQERPRD